MGQNLKSRLRYIRDTRKSDPAAGSSSLPEPKDFKKNTYSSDNSSWPGWTEAGFKTLKRKVQETLPFSVPDILPQSLAVLVPDFFRLGRIPSPRELLFFDLETTGLSGGAGTLAFLAAFGRFVDSGQLEITQYLLLDYPGEPDFINTVVAELRSVELLPTPCCGAAVPPLPAAALPHPHSLLPIVVTFNGKSFDSQILKTRCLMNGIMVPEYYHADLLHPARRLWKRLLPDCAQTTIETSLLGLDRTGDVSGALAPDIWFSFLRTGGNNELLAVCDHNKKDILGLASLFLCFDKIAAAPFESRKKFRFDEEALALSWREALKKAPSFFGDDESYQSHVKTGELLLETAVKHGYRRAAFVFALDLFKQGRSREGRALMLKTAEDSSGDEDQIPGSLKAAALRSLAIDAEWALCDSPAALEYTNSALEIPDISTRLRKELEKRRSRLMKKIN
ncbi:MAG: ribonuclease H-like domain-containing protein [Treponema sp.]|nr:ribonuclease H-like domain-containing protein [Treponema sp.]